MATYLEYMNAAMRRAEYERIEEEGDPERGEGAGVGWYGHIPGFEGWASGASVEQARAELWEALDGWLAVNFFVSQLPLPDIGVRLGVEKTAE